MASIRPALVLLSAAVGLGGCSSFYGAPGYGVSAGYGSQAYYDPYRDPYYYDRYGYPYRGYGSRYYGAGYGYPYGWYDGFYYPGAGFYVYDRSGSRHRWTDRQRRHWEGRSKGLNRAVEEWSRRQPGATGGTSGSSSVGAESGDSVVVRMPRRSSEARRQRAEQREMERSEAPQPIEPPADKHPE